MKEKQSHNTLQSWILGSCEKYFGWCTNLVGFDFHCQIYIHMSIQVSSLVEKTRTKFLLAPMGVPAPDLRMLDPPLSPPSTLAEVFQGTCLQSKLQNFQK